MEEIDAEQQLIRLNGELYEGYLQELVLDKEVYVYDVDGSNFCYIFPDKGIAVHVKRSYVDNYKYSHGDIRFYIFRNEEEPESVKTDMGFELIKTETVVHSLSGSGMGRGNFLLLMREITMNYYDFVAEGDTLRFKNFQKPLKLIDVAKAGNKYRIVLSNDFTKNYFFEYTPKGAR
ncbi:MAG: hypothetical protein LIP00_00855 [Parabacteroides sp.]|nr:hypothetical protein [Parabacteroides sp.]